MTFQIEVSELAVRDLEELAQYVTVTDSPTTADRLVNSLEKKILSLQTQPWRGSVPFELSEMPSRSIRQVYVGPYRIVYHVQDKKVTVFLVADGRRRLDVLIRSRIFAR